MKIFEFSLKNKILFYFFYFYFKLLTFSEVKKGKERIYLAEFIWIFNQFFKLNLSIPGFLETDYFVTRFGKFYITPDLVSTITVSPAFERRDIDYLLNLISGNLKKKEKILFIDIGANFGLYSVIVGNRFKGKVDIISFEPNTTYLTSPTYALLRRNIIVNKIKNIKLYKIGIGSANTKKVNKAGFTTSKLDHVIGKDYLKKYDIVFIKVDVDDFVLDVLKGIQDCVNNGKEVILLVEDFVDKRSIKHLQKNWEFMDKRSIYNSFWYKVKA